VSNAEVGIIFGVSLMVISLFLLVGFVTVPYWASFIFGMLIASLAVTLLNFLNGRK